MLLKKIMMATVLIAGTSPLFAYTPDLTIENKTIYPSTSVLNGGLCSTSILGADGITPPKSKKVIKGYQIRLACMLNLENCKADVYMTNNCTGDVISTVTLSVNTGIKAVTPPKNGFVIVTTPFSIQVDHV